MKQAFPYDTFTKILTEVAQNPPSDRMLDRKLLNKIVGFVGTRDVKTPVQVWNFMKEILDYCVRYSAAAPFFITLIDVEPYYEPPIPEEGEVVYLQADGSIRNAPWRK